MKQSKFLFWAGRRSGPPRVRTRAIMESSITTWDVMATSPNKRNDQVRPECALGQLCNPHSPHSLSRTAQCHHFVDALFWGATFSLGTTGLCPRPGESSSFIEKWEWAPPPRPILQWVTKINAFSRPAVEKLRRRAVSELCWWFAPSIGLFYHLVQLPRAKFAKACKPNVNAWSPCLTASFDLICHIPACNLSWSLQSLQLCVVLAFLFYLETF